MSQYRATNDKGEEFAYGYDRPLQEYFLFKDAPEEDSGCINLVGSLSDTYGSAANLLEAIEKHGIEIPEEHRNAMMLDLPF